MRKQNKKVAMQTVLFAVRSYMFGKIQRDSRTRVGKCRSEYGRLAKGVLTLRVFYTLWERRHVFRYRFRLQ